MAKLKEHHIMCAEELANHKSVRDIASTFGVDESTLRYRLERHKGGSVDGRSLQQEACAPYDPVILDWIQQQEERKPGIRREPIRLLYETLQVDYGYEGSYKSVVRYIRRRAGQPTEQPFRRVETKPGTQGQADWLQKKIHIHELGGETKLSAFILTLSHSRMWSVIWSQSENMLSWLTCHNRAFEMLGGIPQTIRIDNLKTGVANGCGVWAKINEGYGSYAKQMDFAIDPHRVRTPRDKGKAERRVQDVKSLQITEKDRFWNLEDLQQTTWERIGFRSKRLTCPVTGKSIYDSWNLEKQYLKPLPLTLPEPFDVQVSREVGRDCLVSFEGRRYSVPYTWTKRIVQVRGCTGVVEIWGEGKKICTFPRKTECRLLVDQNHYEGTDSDTKRAPVPLGKIGREIVIPRSWEIEDAPRRSIDHYAELVGTRS